MSLAKRCCALLTFGLLLLGCGGGGGGGNGGGTVAAPSGLVVQAGASFDQVDLHWTAASGATSYTVEVSRGGGSFVAIPGSLGAATTATSLTFDASFPEALQVGFRVRAQAGGKGSDPSNTALYERGVRAPWGVSATPSPADGTIQVEVTQATLLATTLTLERQPVAGGAWVLVHTESRGGGSGQVTTYYDGALQEGVAYHYRATQASGGFTSAPTQSPSAQIDLLPPADLILTPEPGQVRLRWTNRSTHATALNLVRTDNFNTALPISLPTSTTEYVYPLADITPVFLRLRVDGTGPSALSREVSGAPLPPAGALPLTLELVGLPNWSRMVGSASSPCLLSYDSSWPYTPKLLLPGETETQGYYLPVSRVSDVRLDGQSRPAFAGTVLKDYNTMQYLIKFGYRNGNSVPVEDVATEGLILGGEYLRFALDPSGQPHLVWRGLSEGTSGSPTILRYAHKSGGVWGVETLLTDAAGSMEFGCTSEGTLWLVTWTAQHLQLGSKAPGQAWTWTLLPADPLMLTWRPPLSLVTEGASFSLTTDGFIGYSQAPEVILPIQLSLSTPAGSPTPIAAPVDLAGTGNQRVFAAASAQGRLALVVGSSQNASTYPWMSHTLTLLIRMADGQFLARPLGTMTTMSSGMALLFDDSGKVRFYFNTGYHQGLGSEKVLTLVVSE